MEKRSPWGKAGQQRPDTARRHPKGIRGKAALSARRSGRTGGRSPSRTSDAGARRRRRRLRTARTPCSVCPPPRSLPLCWQCKKAKPTTRGCFVTFARWQTYWTIFSATMRGGICRSRICAGWRLARCRKKKKGRRRTICRSVGNVRRWRRNMPSRKKKPRSRQAPRLTPKNQMKTLFSGNAFISFI